MKWTKRLGKGLGVGAVLTVLSTGGAGCLSRPVGGQPPTTKVNFTSNVSQQAVDKVDLLFAIDNSASMGDKQTILSEAVPVLLDGLLTPKCVNPATEKPVDASGNDVQDVTSANIARAKADGNKDNRYGCPGTSEPEFKPVSDMHIGIVSSSLGNFGAGANDRTDYVCPPENKRMNDMAHLLNFNKEGGDIPEAKPGNFLAWFPTNEENKDEKRHPVPTTPTGDLTKLKDAFTKLVVGTDQTGCGLEAQLESFYRFLIQPDPWVNVKLDGSNQAEFEDTDRELLQQRADFLRPDSLVAIIMLTDEDDSSSDPLAVGGQGWAFMSRKFPGSKVFRQDSASGTTAPRGTTACTAAGAGPGSPDCTSCGFQSLCNQSEASCQKIRNDANCKTAPGDNQEDGHKGYYGPTDDNLNVRFHRMKERYGIDPQYPIDRYVTGLTKTRVPDRASEHQVKVNGTRREISGYTNVPKCTNPLFAKSLPRNPGDELCNLARSTRSPDLIFFAVVGGVPNELLHFDPLDAEKSRITNDDWIKILGRDPKNYDYSGIDPHMIQSVSPRVGLEPPSATRGDNGSDKAHGREWDTQKDDLQYACTFPLRQDLQRVCTSADTSCDCGNLGKNPPLCDANEQTRQTRAKAYPTIREFQVVRAVGEQGVAASLCPITLEGDKNDPRYGYNPAVSAIIDRLKNALTTQCLPQKLRDKAAAKDSPVSCLILAQLAEPTDVCPDGTTAPNPDILKVFLEQQKAESGAEVDGGLNLAKLPVCEVQQRVVPEGQTCRNDTDVAWCYVEGGKKCPQEIHFTTGTQKMVGARFSLQCINQFSVTDEPPQQ